MAHAQHLRTAYEEAALQHEEATALIHRLRLEGALPTREELEREANTWKILKEALDRYLTSGE